ncbi:hypothetical protein AB0E77_30820 [Streptomyces sp. NPDC032940]|uniref:hypothetical protein n=1 Tax=unclassified Streptomyces TaxID=2593676 RepID=UPI000989B51D|nr:hypothetical protein [Streptomyces sp. JHA26]
MRRTAALLSGLLVAAGLNLVAAPSASAAAEAYGCPGSQIDTYNIKDENGSTWGSIYLYYSSANGGTNCVINMTKKYAGQRHYMDVKLWHSGDSDKDEGYFTQYAGPATVTNSNGKCITLSGWVADPAYNKIVGDQWQNVHCG